MAQSWTSPGCVYLILILLNAAIAQEDSNPNNQSDFSTQTFIPQDAETIPPVITTINITETMTSQASTINILSVMSERDRFHEESERLRVAVIILGIFFALAAVAITVGLVWFFIIRRRSEKLKSENQAPKRTSAGQKTETPQNNITKTQDKDKSPHVNAKGVSDNATKQQGKEPSKSHTASTLGTSSDYECQSTSSDKVQPKAPQRGPNEVYANTRSGDAQSAANTGANEQEVYIELDDGKPTLDTSAAKMATRPSSSQRDSSTDELYENFTPATSENYSQLDTENQYDHHYQ